MKYIENILILGLFILAITYIVNLIVKSLSGKKQCSSACGGACSREIIFVQETENISSEAQKN